ncbi:MAG: hypothetical protein SFW36_11950 [Leptolyngbyaceae cyanobacterium bins.59]|nr:hypothetical protein [Leptolyngbyaceae cyanobacterium bins.59]
MLKTLKRIAYRSRDFLIHPILEQRLSIPPSTSVPTLHQLQPSDTIAQLQLQLTYKSLMKLGCLPSPSTVGFKSFSQTDEDGILLFIFSIIGSFNKQSVEICAGNGIECNTANLIINHGWHGLMVDGNQALINEGLEFFMNHPQTHLYPPKLVHTWITQDNVNDIIRKNGFTGEMDLLSIDMDGMDYWIWQAIDCIQPRVVVVEYQDILGPERSLTVPYQDDFNAYDYPTTSGMPNFCGASLPAFVKLAGAKNYRLVSCNRYGHNAFFIKNPLGLPEIPEIDIQECFKHPKTLWGMKERFQTVKDLPWVEV